MRPLPLNYPAVGTKLFIRPWLWPRHLLREAIDTRLRLGRLCRFFSWHQKYSPPAAGNVGSTDCATAADFSARGVRAPHGREEEKWNRTHTLSGEWMISTFFAKECRVIFV